MVINSEKDIISIFISILVGFGICFIYDIFKSFRLSFKNSNIAVLFEDILFFIIAGLITYTLLFVRAYGKIRWFILISELIGFILFRCYISKYLIRFNVSIIKFVKKTFLAKIKSALLSINKTFNDKIDKLFAKKSKKSLKDNRHLLYNNLKKNLKRNANVKKFKNKQCSKKNSV